jgi:hypothetical protein
MMNLRRGRFEGGCAGMCGAKMRKELGKGEDSEEK